MPPIILCGWRKTWVGVIRGVTETPADMKRWRKCKDSNVTVEHLDGTQPEPPLTFPFAGGSCLQNKFFFSLTSSRYLSPLKCCCVQPFGTLTSSPGGISRLMKCEIFTQTTIQNSWFHQCLSRRDLKGQR